MPKGRKAARSLTAGLDREKQIKINSKLVIRCSRKEEKKVKFLSKMTRDVAIVSCQLLLHDLDTPLYI